MVVVFKRTQPAPESCRKAGVNAQLRDDPIPVSRSTFFRVVHKGRSLPDEPVGDLVVVRSKCLIGTPAAIVFRPSGAEETSLHIVHVRKELAIL